MIKIEIIPNADMYFDIENGPEVEEDFLTALNLLHSTDDNSAEDLRKILDSLIEKKFGPTKTLAARRMCRESSPLLSAAGSCANDKKIRLPSQNESAITQYLNIYEFPKNDGFHTYAKTNDSPNITMITKKIGQQMANILVDVDKTEIPTISIPDEGPSTGDGVLCKTCNGPRLGPLILLECQECQDVYHPLCHQPPVLDLDIYDPRLVWHCAKCIELSEAAAIIAAAGFEGTKFQIKNPGISKNHNELRTDGMIDDDSKEHLNFFRRNIKSRLGSHQETPVPDQFQLRNRTSIGRRSAKRQTNTVEQVLSSDRNGSLRNPQTLPFPSTSSSVLNLRKRVGSKLTMTRGTAK